ncbi:MAG: Protein GrpE [Phycisphaerae bacterium]|nr:Protein GrpE [Phycisphaerae bacterium]
MTTSSDNAVADAEPRSPEPAGEGGAAAEGGGAAPPEAVTPAGPATPEERIAALEREVAALRDENLRIIAEARNQQQRAARDRQEALKFAEADFARELLVILDDFDRTLDSARGATDVKAVAEGVRIVYEHFLKVLKSRNVESFASLGQPFDPSRHEALLRQPSEQYAEGTVMNEVARGYSMHERILRAARVIVSAGKGG